ncbi:MAG TPA: hypothetical protein PLW93_05480, partial [Candidatus Absconditabacterales bacterium]|nr:hypothetical protein [Candidatus Absconditabacterales bacterium]
PEAWHHLNEYLFKSLQHDYTLKERVLELLDNQIQQEDKSKYLLSDSYNSEDITNILTYIIHDKKEGTSEQIDRIFDAGLKYGASNFYEMFDKFYNK